MLSSHTLGMLVVLLWFDCSRNNRMHMVAANVEGQEKIVSEAANFADCVLYYAAPLSVELNGSMF